MAKKDQITVMLPPELVQFIKAEAAKQLVPASFIVRKAVEHYQKLVEKNATK